MKNEKLIADQKNAEAGADGGPDAAAVEYMDEDARWELALRQKQEADRKADKAMEKELVKNGIAKLKELIAKKKGKKERKKDKKHKKKSISK